MAAALTVPHSLVPPHPAPSAAAQLLGADLGRTILYGVAASIPMAVIGGALYGGWISKKIYVPVPPMASREPEPGKQTAPPPVPLVILVLILPVLFIFASTIADLAKSPGQNVLGFFGHPFAALLVTTLIAMLFSGARRGLDRNPVARMD